MYNEQKINIASYRVLRTLMCLFEHSLTMDELVDEMKQYVKGTFNNFVASKYINTCKSCGIDIQKVDGKYSLVNMPLGIKFSKQEAELMNEIKEYSENLKVGTDEKIVNRLIDKMHMSKQKASVGLKSSKNFRIITLFDRAYNASCGVTIVFKDGTSQECTPQAIKVRNDKIYFTAKRGKEIQEINPDDIVDIKLDDENIPKAPNEGVIFELRGKLAKRYQLRENEQLLRSRKEGVIVISNKYEDRDKLLHRLLRYDSSCKVLKPASCVEEMKKLIDKTLSNYGE